MGTRLAADLQPGDTFTRDNVRVTVLHDREPCTDRFWQGAVSVLV